MGAIQTAIASGEVSLQLHNHTHNVNQTHNVNVTDGGVYAAGNNYNGQQKAGTTEGGNANLSQQLRDMQDTIIAEVRNVPSTIARQQMDGKEKQERRANAADHTDIPGMPDLQSQLFSPTTDPKADSPGEEGQSFFNAQEDPSPSTAAAQSTPPSSDIVEGMRNLIFESSASASNSTPVVETVLSEEDTPVQNNLSSEGKPKDSDSTEELSEVSILWYEQGNLVMKGKGELAIGDFNTANKALEVQLLEEGKLIDLSICIDQVLAPIVEPVPVGSGFQVWLDMQVTEECPQPRRLLRAKCSTVLETLIDAIIFYKTQAESLIVSLYKCEGQRMELIVTASVDCCTEEDDQNSMLVEFELSPTHLVLLDYSHEHQLGIDNNKKKERFAARVFVGRAMVHEGFIVLSAKLTKCDGLDFVLTEFQKGRSKWLGPRRKGAPQVEAASKDDDPSIDYEELSIYYCEGGRFVMKAQGKIFGGMFNPSEKAINFQVLTRAPTMFEISIPVNQTPTIERGGDSQWQVWLKVNATDSSPQTLVLFRAKDRGFLENLIHDIDRHKTDGETEESVVEVTRQVDQVGGVVVEEVREEPVVEAPQQVDQVGEVVLEEERENTPIAPAIGVRIQVIPNYKPYPAYRGALGTIKDRRDGRTFLVAFDDDDLPDKVLRTTSFHFVNANL